MTYTLDKDGVTVLETVTQPVDIQAKIDRVNQIDSNIRDLQQQIDALTTEKTSLVTELSNIQTAVPETASLISAVTLQA